MEYPVQSLGQYLKEQRETKGLSIDEVAIETNIARKYIEALEKDEYGFFPAEMYVTGFLSAYIEILEVDKELVLSMYQRAVNKEKEVPLEAFYQLHSTSFEKEKYIKWLMISLPIIFVIFVVGILVVNLSSTGSSQNRGANRVRQNILVQASELSSGKEITLNIYDSIVIMQDEVTITEIVFHGKVQNSKRIKFSVGQNQYTYKVGDILDMDVSGNDVNDFNLEIVAIDENSLDVMVSFQQNLFQATFFDISPYQKSIRNTVPIVDVINRDPFEATVTASRPVWVGYQVDTTEEQQKLLGAGGVISFSFLDGARVSLGNAGAVTITFKGLTNVIQGGTTGESSQSIFYKKTEGNTTRLYHSQLK